MFNKKQYALNTIINNFAFAFHVGVTFILTPMIVKGLGEELYGVWALIIAFTGYFGFFDFGVRAGVGQYVARYLAANDTKALNEVVGTSIIVLFLIGLVGAITSFLCAFIIGPFIYTDILGNSATQLGFFLVGLSICVKFPSIVFQALLNGNHRYDLTGYVTILSKTANALFIYNAFMHHGGLLELAWITFGTQVLEGLMMMGVAYKKTQGLELCIKFNRSTLSDITKYGIFSFAVNISDQLAFYIGPLVIGKQLGPISVTYYSLVGNLMPYLVTLVRLISSPLMQVATSYDVKGSDTETRSLYLLGSRYILWFVGLVSVNVYVYGEVFLRMWVGDKYVLVTTSGSSGAVMKVLLIAYVFFLSQSVGRQVLFGKRLNKYLALLNTFAALCVGLLTCFLVPFYGIIGAAWGLAIPMFIFNGILLPIYIARALVLPAWRFWHTSVLPVLIICVASIIVSDFIFMSPIAKNWNQFIWNVSLLAAVYSLMSTVHFWSEYKSLYYKFKTYLIQYVT